jgi:hypothetical protein
MSDMETSSLPELLDVQEGTRVRRRRRHQHSTRSRWFRRIRRLLGLYNWRIVLLVIFSVIAVFTMSGVLLSVNARDKVNDSWHTLDRVWYGLSNKPAKLTLSDFERLQRAVNDLNGSLSSARRQTLFLRPLTFASADLQTSLDTLDAAQQMTLASSDILVGMKPAVFFLTAGEQEESVATQISSGERVVELLSLGRGRFLSAERLASAKAILMGWR